MLAATRPDVLHVHNLLNLSFELPRLARSQGVATTATLHDYTLVCASGGQRVHAAESHICHTIDPERCRRCFASTPFRARMAAATLGSAPLGRWLRRAASSVRRVLPVVTDGAARRLPLAHAASADDMSARQARARQVLDEIDLLVAPSASLGSEFVRLGADPRRVEVSDYGFRHQAPLTRAAQRGALRIGFIGSFVWHKGAHVLLDAVRLLRGSFEVVVAGDPQVGPEYHARLQRAAMGLPVRFTGPFDRDDLPRAYAALDVLVVPSLWPENSPLVVHEAFMHGVAVVGARQGGIPGLVTDGVNGVTYDAFSAPALAAALQQFVDDPGLAARLAARAPAIKSIEDDAREWEARYASLRPAAAARPA